MKMNWGIGHVAVVRFCSPFSENKMAMVTTKNIRYRACALRTQGLLLEDAPTVGMGKTFWRVGQVPLTKTGVTQKRKVTQ